jgi:hypothetical protein
MNLKPEPQHSRAVTCLRLAECALRPPSPPYPSEKVVVEKNNLGVLSSNGTIPWHGPRIPLRLDRYYS